VVLLKIISQASLSTCSTDPQILRNSVGSSRKACSKESPKPLMMARGLWVQNAILGIMRSNNSKFNDSHGFIFHKEKELY
jgi:hypothetical protein